jgi:hypothetical protein
VGDAAASEIEVELADGVKGDVAELTELSGDADAARRGEVDALKRRIAELFSPSARELACVLTARPNNDFSDAGIVWRTPIYLPRSIRREVDSSGVLPLSWHGLGVPFFQVGILVSRYPSNSEDGEGVSARVLTCRETGPLGAIAGTCRPRSGRVRQIPTETHPANPS